MKRLLTMLFSLVLISSFSVGALATTISEDLDGYAMEDIQAKVLSYLTENYPDIKIGTAEFQEFAVEQLLGQTDEKLQQDEDYELIRIFLSEYKIRYEQHVVAQVEAKCEDRAAMEDGFNTFQLEDAFLAKTVADLKADNLDKECLDASAQNGIANFAVSGYNGTAAASYARQYAENPNGWFPYYIGADCANFVSQAINAGGVSMQGTTSSAGRLQSTTQWYLKRFEKELNFGGVEINYGLTTSWTSAPDLQSYLKYRYGSAKAVTYHSGSLDALSKACAAGDPVFLLNSVGTPYHATIITVKGTSPSTTKYSAHTNARKDAPISNFPSGESYCLMKLASS